MLGETCLNRSYVHRFYPSGKQEEALDKTLRLCCGPYNATLKDEDMVP